MYFLIDSGSSCCIIPKQPNHKIPADRQLFAANGSTINTYGEIDLKISLGLRRNFSFIFIVADVTQPIIGVNFLRKYKLVLDLHNNRLTDTETGLSTYGDVLKNQSANISLLQKSDNKFYNLLQQFPSLLTPEKAEDKDIILPEVYHYIETEGPPVSCKSRRMAL